MTTFPDRSSVLKDLVHGLPARCVVVGDEIPARNCADASSLVPQLPLALILPRSAEEVSSAIAICANHDQPIVVQGGMTGLAGGAHPGPDEVAISLEKMVGIEELDRVSGTMTVLAGTPLHQVQQAAEDAGWLYPIDLGSRGSCTIGGNVATNAGGNHVLRFGMTRKHVLGLEVALANGVVVRCLNKMIKNNSGYDWTQLFIGSEGTLGIVTRVVLKLAPAIGNVCTAMIAVGSTDKALLVLRQLERSLPTGLLAFEVMWREFLDMSEQMLGLTSPFSQRHELNIIAESPMGFLDAGIFDHALESLLVEGLVDDVIVAKSGAERQRFWALRESAYRFAAKLFPGVRFDVSIPLDLMSTAIESMRSTIPSLGSDIGLIIFGHLADSNIHIRVSSSSMNDDLKERVEACVYGVVEKCNGSISAEHGIGRLKRRYLCASRNTTEVALMASTKAWLDPHHLLNRGRIFSRH